jgi:hypothetical protein
MPYTFPNFPTIIIPTWQPVDVLCDCETGTVADMPVVLSYGLSKDISPSETHNIVKDVSLRGSYFSEKSVNIYQTTRCNDQEDSHFYVCRENLEYLLTI